MNGKPMNFVLVGVGGQGTILASDVLAELGLRLGYDVKKAEVHGMSQRGGSVVSNVRWAEQVHSPIIAHGEADVLLAFEKIEAARFADWLRPDGLILVTDYSIVPVTTSASQAAYPTDAVLQQSLEKFTQNTCWIKGVEIAESAGNFRSANVVMLGALSSLLDLDPAAWIDALQQRIPAKYLEINLRAFDAGRQASRFRPPVGL